MAKKVEEVKKEKEVEVKSGDDIMNLKDKKKAKFRGLRVGEKSA
jgi:hypothetical protein